MKLINKKATVSFDQVTSEYTVSLSSDRDGTYFSNRAKTLKDVFHILGKAVGLKIEYLE